MTWRAAWSDGGREWAGCALARGWWLLGREGGEDASVVGPFVSQAEAETAAVALENPRPPSSPAAEEPMRVEP